MGTSRGSVLLIEDDAELSAYLRVKLMHAGFRVMLAGSVMSALPEAWALVVSVRLEPGALSTGVKVVDGAFEVLDVGVLADHLEQLVSEAVELLGPGVFVVPRAEAFRVAAPKGVFAGAGR